MLAEKQNDGRHDIGECDLDLLNEPAEVFEVKLGHDYKLETRVQTLMNQACETCSPSVNMFDKSHTKTLHSKHTVDVEERKEREQLVSIAIRTASWFQIAGLSGSDHGGVCDNVVMSEHDTLGVSRGTG